ncbi:MAG: leucine-rich repeat domain-containing protein [Pirellulaceae bacterium]
MSAAETTVALSPQPPAPTIPCRRWRLQFSLRTLAIFMLLVGVGLGSLGRLIHRAREQSAKVTTLRSFGVTVEYEGSFNIDERGTVWFVRENRAWWKRTLVNWYGEDFVSSVQGLQAFGRPPLSERDREEFWRLATSLPELRKLDVNESWFDPAGLARFRGNTSIKSLTLMFVAPSNEDLAVIGTLTELKQLHLWMGYKHPSHMDDRGITSLDSLKELRSLILDDSGITDKSMPLIARHRRLQTLGLRNTRITDEGAHYLSGLTELRALDLSESRLTDEGLKNLSGLTQLRYLGLSGTGVTDEGLEHLVKLADLETLEVRHTEVHGPGVAALASLPRLTSVRLRKNPVKDEDVHYFADLPELESLDLEQTLVTDAGIKTLQLGPKVIAISILGTSVTDEGLMFLARYPQLKVVRVEQSRITPEGMAMLKKQLPNCQFGPFSPTFKASPTKPLE